MIHDMIMAAAGATGPVEPTDADFENTVLLLHGDGTNGAQNNTFIDSSTNNFTITRNGNTTQGTFTPFSKPDGAWGNYFDGSGDNLVIGNPSVDTALDFGSGDFTIEAWVNLNNTSSTLVVGSLDNNTGNGAWWIQVNSTFGSGGTIQFGYNTTAGGSGINILKGTGTLTAYSWNHIAVTRDGSNIRCYLNGSQLGTTDTGIGGSSIFAVNQNVRIGASVDNAYQLNGFVSNLRILKGTALYTGSTYTVPTAPLTAITNTSRLTCQSNRFIDNSSNNFAITRNGDVKVTPFSPFPITTAYSTSVNGGAGYFDGSGDYIQLADNAALELASESNWTVEFWGYFVSTPSDFDVIIGKGTGSGSYEYFFEAFADNTIDILYSADGTTTWTGQHQITPAIPNGQWFHLAAVRNGATFKSYVNGVEYFSGSSFNIYAGSGVLNIGGYSGSATQDPNMYLSGLRIVKGSAVYTSNFTVPTAPPTAITNTSLLCNFTNAGIFDNTGFNALETVADAQIDTSVKKYGTGSMEFDGNGDYLIMPDVLTGQFGTGDFTVEYWDYHGSQSSNFAPQVGTLSSATPAGTWRFGTFTNDGGVYLAYHTGSAYVDVQFGSTLYNDSTWRHFALTRSNGTVRAFVNGVQVGSDQTITQNFNSGNRVVVGAELLTPTYFNGYIDDLRITKGIARYTTTFTPPTAALPDLGA
jgi:hypothetical protein